MTNELKERLEALSADLTEAKSHGNVVSSTILGAALQELLVSAFKAGDLITRQELDEAVAAEREGMVGDTAKLLQQWFIKGLSSEKMQDAPFVAARARSEQKGGA